MTSSKVKPAQGKPAEVSAPKVSPPNMSEDALQRLIKRHVLGVPHTALMRFPKGFGAECAAEVKCLLARGLLQPKMPPNVTLTETSLDLTNIGWRDLLAVAASATTAREVLWHIGGGRAGSVGELKDRLSAVNWPLYLGAGTAIAIRANSTASHVFHEGKIAELAAATLKKVGVLVIERENADHLLDLRLDKDRLSLSLSLSGRPLYMRRYKDEMRGVATIKEDIAASALAACVSFASEHGVRDFGRVLVPFAGSGTLGFEAAIAFGKLPPAIFFGPLSAEAFPCCPIASVRFAETKALSMAKAMDATAGAPVVTFNEIDADASAYLEKNIAAFNATLTARDLAPRVMRVVTGDVFKLGLAELAQAHGTAPTLVLLNPPFGARLGAKATTGRTYANVAKELNRILGPKAGFALAPTIAVADQFLGALKTKASEVRPFNHGGRTVYLVLFA